MAFVEMDFASGNGKKAWKKVGSTDSLNTYVPIPSDAIDIIAISKLNNVGHNYIFTFPVGIYTSCTNGVPNSETKLTYDENGIKVTMSQWTSADLFYGLDVYCR